jgi:hypothetical protein
MARIAGAAEGPGLLGRFIFRAVRKRLGRVPVPLRIAALQPPLLVGVGLMESGQQKASALPVALKRLAQVRVATRVGCPF